MSLLDNLLGGQDEAGGGLSLMSVVSQLLEKAGGVQGLIAMLQQHGLGEAVQSWIGSGSNLPVSGEQLGQALQKGGLGSLLQEAAGSLGTSQEGLLGSLAKALPAAVDHMTPDGQAPSAGGFDLGMLEGLAGKLLG